MRLVVKMIPISQVYSQRDHAEQNLIIVSMCLIIFLLLLTFPIILPDINNHQNFDPNVKIGKSLDQNGEYGTTTLWKRSCIYISVSIDMAFWISISLFK